MAPSTAPCLHVALVDPLGGHRVSRKLAAFPDLDVQHLAPGSRVDSAFDVVVYDAFLSGSPCDPPVHDLAGTWWCERLAVYTDDVAPDHVTSARRAGLAGCLSSGWSSARLARALRRCGQGGFVSPATGTPAIDVAAASWPGARAGLSRRQAQVLALMAAGRRNQQIADHLGISINSVKTHVRLAYRTIHVSSRPDAILWCVDHELRPTLDDVTEWLRADRDGTGPGGEGAAAEPS